MKISEVIDMLEKFAPPSLAEEWDNVGLMVGGTSGECSGVMLALDITDGVIEQAIEEGCNIIVTHHPFIFRPINRIDLDTAKGRQIAALLKNGIAVYSMHTNLDKAEKGINRALADLLGKNASLDGCGVVFDIEPQTLGAFAKTVAQRLDDRSVRIVGDPNAKISRVYAVSGSGASEYGRARECADALLTGDLKHHNYIDALGDAFPLAEYSHFSSEIIMQDILKAALDGAQIKIIKAKQNSPFRLLEEI